MTQSEARAALVAGSQNTTSELVTVVRKHLLVALGAAQEETGEGTTDGTDEQQPAAADDVF